MPNEWSTSSYDLYVARQVISQHTNEDKPLGIFEIVLSENGQNRVFLAEWVKILRDFYHYTYGEEQGEFVMRKVVTTCLTTGETIH